MNIPENSFISLVEYNDPMISTVSWTNIDSGETVTVRYEDEADVLRINLITKQQVDVIRDVPVGQRNEALRALCEDRP